jgi:hypothetical protein
MVARTETTLVVFSKSRVQAVLDIPSAPWGRSKRWAPEFSLYVKN